MQNIGEKSAWRELKGIEYSLGSFKSILIEQKILRKKVISQRQKIVKREGEKNYLQIIAENNFYICRKNRTYRTVNCVPGEYLRFADTLSRLINPDEAFFRLTII